MGIRDRSFFAVPLLAVLFLVVGCSSSESQIIDESKYEDLYDDDADSGDDADSVDDSEGFDDEDFPDPPELPDAVKDESEDGAIAAAEYFLDAYEYAYLTSDAKAMQEIVSEECEVCWQLMDVFDDRLTDGEYSTNVEFSYQVTDEFVRNEYGSVIPINLQINSHDVVDNNGVKVDHFDEQDADLSFLLNHNNVWRIEDIATKDADD